MLEKNAAESDRETNLEAYYGGLNSMYERASNYKRAYESYSK